MSGPKGFTLIELLVVIAILAVLAVTVVLIINPAELIKQGRDSTRLSDLANVNSAVALYLADVNNATFSTTNNCTSGTTDHDSTACTENATTTVDGNGWVNLNFGNMSTGSPLPRLPLDPSNGSTYFYVWGSNTSEQYELNAIMESVKFANGGGSDVESDDGGDSPNVYELGNHPGLSLL